MAEPIDIMARGSPDPIDRAAIDMTLDVTELPCPVPVLKTQKALAGLSSGATLEVLASDPASEADMKALCHALGHDLMESHTLPDTAKPMFRFVIRKA